ncbi:MAG: DUF6311 domain-containing protein [Pseudomonadota bacterium]
MTNVHMASHQGGGAPIWFGHELNRIQACVLALVLAIGLVSHLYPWSFIAGHSNFFERGDAAHHLIGWLAYVADEWRFPLMRTLALNPPDGINVIFTDSIPLAALVFKLLRSGLPEGFHYFGWWHAFIYVAQGLAAVCLLRALGVRHLLGTVVGVSFALMSPVMTYRTGHIALATHALILLAIAISWMGLTKQWSSQRAYLWMLPLTIAAMLVHAYLFGMVLLFLLLMLVEFWRQNESVRTQLFRLSTIALLIGVTGWLFGYWGTRVAAQGFGIYSMNLLSPFCGRGVIYACGFDGTGGQYEGYNYLGIGTMLLIVASLACCWRGWRTLIGQQAGFFLLLVLLLLFSLSNEIYVGTVKLVSIPLPNLIEKLFNVFRASGRFFWPVGYALLFISIAILLRRPSVPRVAVAVLALALQWLDTASLRDVNMGSSRQPVSNATATWEGELAGINHIAVYPPYLCPSHAEQESVLARLERVALAKKLTMNTAFFARGKPDCDAQIAPFHRAFEANKLYLVPSEFPDKASLPAGFQTALRNGQCAVRPDAMICRTDYDRQRWIALAASQKRRVVGQWSASAGSRAPFPYDLPGLSRASTVYEPQFVSGWSEIEPWGRWSDGQEAVLNFNISAAIPRASAYQLHIEASAFLATDRLNMKVTPFINGKMLSPMTFAGGGITQARADIPASEVHSDKSLTVVLQIDQPTSPCQLGLSGDCRLLGIGVRSIQLETY